MRNPPVDGRRGRRSDGQGHHRPGPAPRRPDHGRAARHGRRPEAASSGAASSSSAPSADGKAFIVASVTKDLDRPHPGRGPHQGAWPPSSGAGEGAARFRPVRRPRHRRARPRPSGSSRASSSAWPADPRNHLRRGLPNGAAFCHDEDDGRWSALQ
ncbi:MAG: hypothetical protein M0C28_04800 [Candidatus Moduliflexus flocculans]|nr:hypothetical protein [Candidatus Moduliflexus flocculans]